MKNIQLQNLNTSSHSAFKYRSGDSATLERDIKSLTNDYFYAPLRTKLNDPFEGRFDRNTLDKQFRAFSMLGTLTQSTSGASLDNIANATDEVLAFVDKCGVFSLSQTPLNELMWAHYGGSHKGFCVEYDLEKLVEFEKMQYHCINVKYMNSAPEFAVSDLIANESVLPVLQKLLGTKSTPWQYELESRVITSIAGQHQYDYRAVKAIYFGLHCSDSTRADLMKMLAGRGIQYKQIVSPTKSYVLSVLDIIDPFQDAPPYKSKIAPIAEGAIYSEYLKKDQKQYTNYLLKAAEIVRREPYCEEVQLVDFSGSESTPTKPVIYVQYKRSENRWVNHYLTLSEIDEKYDRLQLE